jgi:hypothetical protein
VEDADHSCRCAYAAAQPFVFLYPEIPRPRIPCPERKWEEGGTQFVTHASHTSPRR